MIGTTISQQHGSLRQIVLDFSGKDIKVGFGGRNAPAWSFPYGSNNLLLMEDRASTRSKVINILQTIFNDYLHSKPRSSQIVVVEPIFWAKAFRDSLYTSLFLDFQVPLVSFQPRAGMAMLAAGLSGGISVYVSENEIEAVSFADNRQINSSYVSSIIDSSQQSILDDALRAIGEVILESIQKSPLDIRRSLAQNIIIYGDSSLIGPLKDRIAVSLIAIASDVESYKELTTLTFNVVNTAFPMDVMAWIGGSLFSSISSNVTRYVSKDSILHERNATIIGEGVSLLAHSIPAPDWLSTDRSDWVFISSVNV